MYDRHVNQRDVSQSAIVRTLLYAHVFGCGVRRKDIPVFLLSRRTSSARSIHTDLSQLVGKKVVQEGKEWVWVGKTRTEKDLQLLWEESEKKKKYLSSLLPFIVWIPTLQGVAITGSVAVGNANSEEDIDLLLVTKKGFLWLTRALVEAILLIRGVLRTRNMDRVRNKLCLNLWLDTSSLSLPKHTLYVARELIQSQWLLNRGSVRERLFFENMWAASYVANAYTRITMPAIQREYVWEILGICVQPLETIAFFLERWYMRGLTREIVTHHAAFFHPRNTNQNVLSVYQKLCRQYKIDPLP